MGFLSAINPLLLWGGLAVASPIIIHLLSKRRFKIVRWAAMDFLLQADKQNRRRVRLEHLLLLLLRCLIVLLIAALLARLVFDPAGLGAAGINLGRCEHVVLLDDSPSMRTRNQNLILFDTVKKEMTALLRGLSEQRPQDSLTLLLTSDPAHPVERGASLDRGNVETLIRKIDQLAPSDVATRMDDALLAIKDQLQNNTGDLNRTVLIVSDFRRRDWIPHKQTDKEDKGPLALFTQLAERNPDVTWQLTNLGDEHIDNLAITAISPPRGAMAEQVPARFDVRIHNFGNRDANDVEVLFSVQETVPLRATVRTIAPGEDVDVPFTFSFNNTGTAQIRAEIGNDQLQPDNVRLFAAQISQGTPVLLVDGEPDLQPSKSETFFLRHALAPPGNTQSGYVIDSIADNQLGDRTLDPYELVIMANVFRLSAQQIEMFAKWVTAGGGLMVFLGDQVDTTSYQEIHAYNPALFPLQLGVIRGDPEEEKWVGLNPTATNHPILRVFAGDSNPLLTRVKFFRWWGSHVNSDTDSGESTAVLATFTDVDKSPAIVESSLGKGRVTVFAVPADDEWTTWVANPSFLVTVQEAAHHMVRPAALHRQLVAGEALREPIDPSKISPRAEVLRPNGESGGTLQAGPGDTGDEMVFEYTNTNRAGFYQLNRELRDTTPDPRLFAVNIDASEGDLTPITDAKLREVTKGSQLKYSRGTISQSAVTGGRKLELWRPLLITLTLALCCEQLLAWTFGRRRRLNTP